VLATTKAKGRSSRPAFAILCAFQRRAAQRLAAAILGQRLRLFRGFGSRRRMLVRVFIQALLEGPNAFTQALADAGKTTRSEQEQDDD
jgi:hypothetical protein